MENSNKIKNIVEKLYSSLKNYTKQGIINFSELDEYEFYFIDEQGHVFCGILEWLYNVYMCKLDGVRLFDDYSGIVLAYENYKKVFFCTFYELENNIIYAVHTKGDTNYNAKENFTVPGIMNDFVMDSARFGNAEQNLPYTLAYSDNVCVYVSKADSRFVEWERQYKPYVLEDKYGTYNNANNFIITTDEVVSNDETSKTKIIYLCEDGLYSQLLPEEFEKLCSYSQIDKNLHLEYLCSKFHCNVLASEVYEQILNKKKVPHNIPDKITKLATSKTKNYYFGKTKKGVKIASIITGAVAAVCALSIGIYFLARNPYITSYSNYRHTSTILSYRGFSSNLVLPHEIKYVVLETVGDNAFNSSKIESVSMNDNYHYIRKSAFSNNPKLSKVSLASELREIGDEAFANCNISEIKIPKNVYYLGTDILKGNPIKKITVGKTLAQKYPEAFSDFNNNPDVEFVYTDDSKTFIPETYFIISDDGKELKMNYYPLENLQIPEGIERISAKYDFSYKSNFKNAKLPSTLKEIDYYLFQNSQITSIELPDSLEVIPRTCFSHCSQLTQIKLGKNVRKIEAFAFSNTAITEFTVPEKVKIIPEGCFFGCNELKKVNFHSDVISIEESAFERSGIEEIILPPYIETIPKSCFAHSELKKIKIPDNVTEIKDYAFEYCTHLESIKIPDSVNKFGYGVFKGVETENLNLPKSATANISYYY